MFAAEKEWKWQEQAFNPIATSEESSRFGQAGEFLSVPDSSQCFEENPRAGLFWIIQECSLTSYNSPEICFILTSFSSTQLRKTSPSVGAMSRGNCFLLQPPTSPMMQNKVTQLVLVSISPFNIRYFTGPSVPDQGAEGFAQRPQESLWSGIIIWFRLENWDLSLMQFIILIVHNTFAKKIW